MVADWLAIMARKQAKRDALTAWRDFLSYIYTLTGKSRAWYA
jgi:hypothetical protein